MILNTNNLPWFVSPEFRAVINANISDHSRACVLKCSVSDYYLDGMDDSQIRIVIDTDGTLVLIACCLYLEGQPGSNIQLLSMFDFAAGLFRYCGKDLPLRQEEKRFRLWENSFVDSCRRGIYKVRVVSIAEVVLKK